MRRYNAFQNLIKAKVQGTMLKEAYEVLGWAYDALNKSHKNYIDLVDKATIEAKGDYLEEYSKLCSEVKVTYYYVYNKRERAKVQGGFRAAESKAIFGMQVFKGSCKVLTVLSLDKNITFAYLRAELAKIEAHYKKLRAEKADVESGIPSEEITD